MAAADTMTEDRSHGDPLELPAFCPGAMAELEALSRLARDAGAARISRQACR